MHLVTECSKCVEESSVKAKQKQMNQEVMMMEKWWHCHSIIISKWLTECLKPMPLKLGQAQEFDQITKHCAVQKWW